MPDRVLPSVPRSDDAARRQFDRRVKENLEILTGQRLDPIEQLVDTSTTSDIIAKINEIIARLQE